MIIKTTTTIYHNYLILFITIIFINNYCTCELLNLKNYENNKNLRNKYLDISVTHSFSSPAKYSHGNNLSEKRRLTTSQKDEISNLSQESEENFKQRPVVSSRGYVAQCSSAVAYEYMWPGNSRYFWSYGYVHLKENYTADCVMDYQYDLRVDPSDPYVNYGYRITGSFEGPTDTYNHCNETDYVMLEDVAGYHTYFCGTNTVIEWSTGLSAFRFLFVSQPDSPTARGFKVKIESMAYCGGSVITGDSATGTIQSSNYPYPYPGNIFCSWLFTVGFGTQITLGCSVFKLNDITTYPNGTEQCKDVFGIAYSDSVTAAPDVTYCREDLDAFKHKIFGEGSNMLVTFKTDELYSDVGFSCDYELIMYGD